MDALGLLDSAVRAASGTLRWLGTLDRNLLSLLIGAAAALFLGLRWGLRRRRAAVAVEARLDALQRETRKLKELLRLRLDQAPGGLPNGTAGAPTMGAGEAFEADIAKAADAIIEAGGSRARAKDLLRRRAQGNGAANGRLNGSEAGYWRQLGALSFLDRTHDALNAYSRAADLAPGDPDAHMLVGVLALRAGRLEAAEVAFRRQIELGAGDAGGQARYRGHTLLGDVLAAKGEPAEALEAYEAALREVAALSEREPDDVRWQRDLSVACDRIGDALATRGELDAALASYKCSLEVVEALVQREPGNVLWQRDLSITHDRIGDALDRKGDLDGALASYRRGLAIAEALAKREPARAEWQWDLSASLDRIGDLLMAKGRTDEAVAVFRRGLGIAESLARSDPANMAWQRDLAVSCHKLGTIESGRDNAGEARELLERGRAIIARLDGIAAHQAQWRADLSKFDQALRTLDP